MRKALIITILCLCFCNAMAFADDTSTNAAGSTGIGGPIGAIINVIDKIDDWIQKNIW